MQLGPACPIMLLARVRLVFLSGSLLRTTPHFLTSVAIGFFSGLSRSNSGVGLRAVVFTGLAFLCLVPVLRPANITALFQRKTTVGVKLLADEFPQTPDS